MIKKISEYYCRYRSIVLYLVLGVCTTLVNVAAYWVCHHGLGWPIMTSTIMAWLLAVLFAYVTNRKWVFESEETSPGGIMWEMGRFFSCRFATGVLDWACMLVFVDLLRFNDLAI